MSEFKTFLKQSFDYFTGHIIVMAAGFISFPILTRIFSVNEYGSLALITTTILITSSISKFGLQNAVIRFFSIYKARKQLNTFFTTTFITSVQISLLASVLFLIIIFLLKHTFLRENNTNILNLVAGFMLVSSLAGILTSFLRAEQRTKLFNLLEVIGRYSSLGMAMLFTLYIIRGLYGFFIGQIISGSIILLFLIRMFFKKELINIKLFSRDISWQCIRFGFPLMLTELAYDALSYIDRYFIQLYLGSKQLGLYTAGYNLSIYVVDIVMYPIVYGLTPIYLDMLTKKGEQETKEFLSNSLKYFLMVLIPLNLLFISLSKHLIVFLATSKYLQSVAIVPYVVIGQSVYACSRILNAGLFISKKSFIFTYLMAISCCLNVVLNMFLIPNYGIIGAAIATLISYIAYTSLITYYSFKEFGYRIDYLRISLYGIAGLTMFLVVNNMEFETDLLNIINKGFIGVFIYSALIVIFDKEIRRNAVKLLGKVIDGWLRKGNLNT